MDTELKHTVDDIIIQPFPINFDCFDFHVIAFIKNHPEYESIEAMIKEYEDGRIFIRAIITDHKKVQIDYINDISALEKYKYRKTERKAIFTPIEYQRVKKWGKLHIILKFTSIMRDELILDFIPVSKATTKYTGLIDPCGHSANTSLPVMYPERTTLAAKRSIVKINGKRYKLPVKVWIPLLFKGMHAYYSELFKIGVFRAGREKIEIIKQPVSLKAGEKWVYRKGTEQLEYEILKVEGKRISIISANSKIEAQLIDDSLFIKSISVSSPYQSNITSSLNIVFTPFLPVIPKGLCSVLFKISIDEHMDLITGTASATKENGAIIYLMEPSLPDWAVSRAISTVVEKQEDGYLIKTELVG